MNDKSIAALKATLLAKREWLTTASKRDPRYRRVEREVREGEAELAALGEALEPERRRAPSGSARKVYYAQHRMQMVGEGWEGENTLAMHEDRGDGTPLCGQPLRDWTDPKTGKRWRSVWSRHGAGPVECGKCANISGEPTGYEPLAEPQGDSVRTVSGGAFEMNPRRH